MAITLNGSGTITGVSSLATALVNPVVTTTMGVGNATPAATGSGITFPAAQSASSDANTLDDYEEGTWTPSFAGGTFTYVARNGTYTKIGNQVTVNLYINTNSVSGTAGNAVTITGLPFSLSSTMRVPVPIFGDSWNTANPLYANVDGLSTPTTINLYKSKSAAGNGTAITVGDMQTLAGGYNQTYITLTYLI